MWIMLLYQDEIRHFGEYQIHRVHRLSSWHARGRVVPKPYCGLLGSNVDSKYFESRETVEQRLYRLRISGFRVAETVSGSDIGNPQVTTHQIGMPAIEAVDQDRGSRDSTIPSAAHAELD